jgi:DNA gyrase/topoisomerase IV subunit A
LLIDLIRNSDSRADSKIKIMKAFEINDEQADAVLDMKLSRLSKLDLSELSDDESKYREQVAALHKVINDEEKRFEVIEKDLDDMKRIIGKDERLTEIIYNKPIEGIEDQPLIKKEWLVYPDGVVAADELVAMSGSKAVQDNLIDVVFAYSKQDIFGFNAASEIIPLDKQKTSLAGAFVYEEKKPKIVAVTKNGNIKVSLASEYKFSKIEKVMKLKDGDELVMVSSCGDQDFVVVYDGEGHLLKLAVADLPVASKATLGVKTGFTNIVSAFVAADGDLMLCVTADNKGKFTPIKDFSVDSRGNKGQLLAEGTKFVRAFEAAREDIYLVPKQGKVIVLNRSKLSIKSRTAQGASVSTRALVNIV